MSTPMMAITTNSSISVNPFCRPATEPRERFMVAPPSGRKPYGSVCTLDLGADGDPFLGQHPPLAPSGCRFGHQKERAPSSSPSAANGSAVGGRFSARLNKPFLDTNR